MVAVVKQDSNFTNLTYAVEQSPGVLPGTPVWLQQEPNSYAGKFGADVKTKQRMPISASRQLKKAVVVDLDATGGWNQDLTYSNFQDLAQAFMFALYHTKSEIGNGVTAGVQVVASTHQYSPLINTGGATYFAGDLLFAKGFANATNNGLKTVTGFPDETDIVVSDVTVVNEAANGAGVISRVGFQFNSGEVTITNAGAGVSYPTLNVVSVSATGTLTNTGVFANNDTITIGGEIYTAQTALTASKGNFLIGGSAAISLTNLANAINQLGAGVPGTNYDTANTPANPRVTATSDATHLFVTAIAGGLVGNAITTTKVSANNSWGAATLTGGTGGRSWTSFGLTIGEFIFVGSDEVNTSFATAVSNGFMRIRGITANTLTLDKTQFESITDTGTGKTIRVYFGRMLRNEKNPTLQVKRTIQVERSLGFPDDALPTQIQGQYLPNSLANTLKLDMKTADIIRLDLGFLANTSTYVTGAQGLKTGTRPAFVSTDAYNSTSDIHFARMAVMSNTDGAPTPLFAFLTDLAIDIKNNVHQNKALAVLGAFSSTAGFFQVQAVVTAYFQNITALQTVISNSSITVETHLVKFQQGISIDVPLVVLASAIPEVKINMPIMIPLTSDASSASNIDTNLDYTLQWVFWDYLPLVA